MKDNNKGDEDRGLVERDTELTISASRLLKPKYVLPYLLLVCCTQRKCRAETESALD